MDNNSTTLRELVNIIASADARIVVSPFSCVESLLEPRPNYYYVGYFLGSLGAPALHPIGAPGGTIPAVLGLLTSFTGFFSTFEGGGWSHFVGYRVYTPPGASFQAEYEQYPPAHQQLPPPILFPGSGGIFFPPGGGGSDFG